MEDFQITFWMEFFRRNDTISKHTDSSAFVTIHTVTRTQTCLDCVMIEAAILVIHLIIIFVAKVGCLVDFSRCLCIVSLATPYLERVWLCSVTVYCHGGRCTEGAEKISPSEILLLSQAIFWIKRHSAIVSIWVVSGVRVAPLWCSCRCSVLPLVFVHGDRKALPCEY